MMKYSFYNDYSEGAHPSLIELLSTTNTKQETGYGDDRYSNTARQLIREQIKDKQAEIYFISGGTQANTIALAAMLRPYEAVISAQTGHINVHEAGAIESTGHKVLTIQSTDGKITPEQIDEVVTAHTDDHMVCPKVVYISNSTELGTVYTKQEVEDLSAYCKKNDLYLFLDGARLGSALMSKDADLTLSDIARLTDMFYIGGTKNGALLGEALVITNNVLKENFKYHLKQRGALLAKGRLLGIQFLGLFTDNLYFDLAKYANHMAEMLTCGIRDCGFTFLTPSTTNQIFPIFPNSLIEELKKDYGFYVWSKIDEDTSSIRLVTSWATPEKAIREFLDDVRKLQ